MASAISSLSLVCWVTCSATIRKVSTSTLACALYACSKPRQTWAFGLRRRFAGLGTLQQRRHFALELFLKPVGVDPTQGLVLASVGLDFGTVQADRSELEQPHRLCPAQDRHEQLRQLRQKPLAEIRDGAVVRMGIGADESARDRVIRRLRQFATAIEPCGIPVKQQRHQHRRRVGLGTGAPIRFDQRTQVQLVDDLHHEPRQVPLREIILDARRQQQEGVSVDRDELYSHGGAAGLRGDVGDVS